MCIAINDKLQGSTANHLSCDGSLYYKYIYIIHFADERILKIDERLAKLRAK